MTNESADEFEGASRIHMALPVQNLEQSIAFYTTLFGQEPSKRRPGYAKFEVAEPRVNLSLNHVVGNTAPVHAMSHFGIQTKSTGAVRTISDRLLAAGLETRVEEAVACCYAVQNKVWTKDPDGHSWEVYVVLDNDAATHTSSNGTCCPKPAADVELVPLGNASTQARSEMKEPACC